MNVTTQTHEPTAATGGGVVPRTRRPQIMTLVREGKVNDRITAYLKDQGFDAMPMASIDQLMANRNACERAGLIIDLESSMGRCHQLIEQLRKIEKDDAPGTPEMAILVLAGTHKNQGSITELVDAGADDFLIKPFGYTELSVRLRRVAEAKAESDPRIIEVDDLRIDTATRLVEVSGRQVNLSVIEYRLLIFLAQDPYKVFEKGLVLREVWGYEPGNTRTMEAHASRLRRWLDPEAKRFVVNLRGVGYSLLDPGRPPKAGRRTTAGRQVATEQSPGAVAECPGKYLIKKTK